MGLLKKLGSGLGHIAGGLVGGAVGFVGSATNSKFISEVGEGIYNSSVYLGDRAGEATQGVWDIGEGLITKNDEKLDNGLKDLGGSVKNTGSALVGSAKHIVKNASDLGVGLLDDDPEKWKSGAREFGKTAAIGILGVSLLDLADVVDVDGNESPANLETVSRDTMIENPNSHFVDAHYVEGHFRGDTWIDGYWRDGDGDTSVDTSGGYVSSNPDYRA